MPIRVLVLLLTFASQAFAAGLPDGFVYLALLDPTIRQDMRYAGPHNFVGRPVAGYEAAECILTRQAATALAGVQSELKARHLSLIVWDCYRPVRAVADFLSWSRDPVDQRMKAEFFPNADKARFFALGYLATRSAHSRGSTVDLGIVPGDLASVPPYNPAAPLAPCTAPKGRRFEDGTIDLGTGHDCLDRLASTDAKVGDAAIMNRALLQTVMTRHGFKPYAKEWWHFELAAEPFKSRSFDFPVSARP